ncbi:MAG TPA: heme-binding protein [Candidatus Eisenbacteria bacterium]|nr:heme-binding protein [Candidatus Eisenbacteria bacterium]
MSIKLVDARRMIDAAMARANEMGIKVSVAVTNEEGNVISLCRMDGAGFLTPDIALGKAIASAAFKRSSAEVQASADRKPAFYAGISTMANGKFLAGMGAVPVVKDKQVIGAVGVSGGKPEQDEEVAKAGISSL